MAVQGTPDDQTGLCNTHSGFLEETGSNAGCVSRWGAFDMVGNLSE